MVYRELIHENYCNKTSHAKLNLVFREFSSLSLQDFQNCSDKTFYGNSFCTNLKSIHNDIKTQRTKMFLG